MMRWGTLRLRRREWRAVALGWLAAFVLVLVAGSTWWAPVLACVVTLLAWFFWE